MKTTILGLSILLLNSIIATAQIDTLTTKPEYVSYTFFYNDVPDNFNLPLIGFINNARGNHKGLQLGFANTTLKDFNGLQVGFVNRTLGNLSGVKLGFVNTTSQNANGVNQGFVNNVSGNYSGIASGFVNVTGGNHRGLQIGFVNATSGDFEGLQAGFVNSTAGNHSGVKLGFVNSTSKNINGVQVGFVNSAFGNSSGVAVGFVNATAQNATGLQLGFVNAARKGIKGSQIGFINYADTISGVPLGFISFVRNGGYRAVETSINELFPVNVAFKIGVPRLYSIIQGSHNSNYEKPFALGFGLGSLISLGNSFYFNPEIGNMHSLSSNRSRATTFAANFRYSINSKLQVAAGLSAAWLNYQQGQNAFEKPLFSFLNHEINDRNRILTGARIALSYNFTAL